MPATVSSAAPMIGAASHAEWVCASLSVTAATGAAKP
jgi:hypothetical protein